MITSYFYFVVFPYLLYTRLVVESPKSSLESSRVIEWSSPESSRVIELSSLESSRVIELLGLESSRVFSSERSSRVIWKYRVASSHARCWVPGGTRHICMCHAPVDRPIFLPNLFLCKNDPHFGLLHTECPILISSTPNDPPLVQEMWHR